MDINKPITLAQLRAINPKAFEKYLEMLVEDCRDQFWTFPDGSVSALTEGTIRCPSLPLYWSGTRNDVTMDVGSGWEANG